MKNDDYKYDVAFSFLKKDEHLANQINDLIKDNLSTFLYSKRLEDLANKKPEKTFIDVFGKQSKIVVVLFRNKWGTTPWTRIEEKAIRNRASNEGYNFLLFIPMDDPPTVPKYLPKSQIWDKLAQSGIKGAATVIEERVKLLADESRKKSPINNVRKINEEPQYEIERSKFLESVHGLEIAELELQKLFSELNKLKRKIEKDTIGLPFNYQQDDKNCIIHCGEFSIRFYLPPAKINPILDFYLYIELQKHGPSSNEANILAIEEYHFEVKKVGEYGWMKEVGSKSFISSKKLAEKSIKLLLSQLDIEGESNT